MNKPKDFNPAWWASNKPKDVKDDPKLASRLLFLHNHYIQYPKYDINSKDKKVMYDRVNMVRQMVAGLKESKLAIQNTIKTCKDKEAKAALAHYFELMKHAEMDRQNWIKIERGVGNTENLQQLLINPGLDKQIPF